MSIGVYRSDKSRHIVVRLSGGEAVLETLAGVLRDEQVACGWLRGGGVIGGVELRSYDAEAGALGSARRLDGRFHALALEGSVGLSNGEPSFSLRALLVAQNAGKLDTQWGEIVAASAIAVEVFVTALDDLAIERTLDEATGIWLLGDVSAKLPPPAGPRPVAAAPWAGAVDASDRADRGSRPRPSPTTGPQGPTAMPARIPVPPKKPEVDAPVPEPGDAVDHFAFGGCDVLKSDGDRLHLRVHKGGRVREIALAMLRVMRVEDAEDGTRRFKLERRI